MTKPTQDEPTQHDPTQHGPTQDVVHDTPRDLPAGTVTPEDEARRRFREALDRKKFGHRAGGGARNPAAQHPHSSPAKPQKTFRRKSGG